eukprot:3132908-Pyramimonas_sp.AAC.1
MCGVRPPRHFARDPSPGHKEKFRRGRGTLDGWVALYVRVGHAGHAHPKRIYSTTMSLCVP